MEKNFQLRDALTHCKSSLIAVAIFSAVANLLMLVPAFFMLNVYDKAVGNNSLSTLWVLSLITAFLFVMMGSMEVLRSQVLSAIASKLDQLLTGTFYDYAFSHAVLVGPEKATTLPLVDINNLRQFLTGTGITAAFDAPWTPIYLAVLFLFHPLLGWLGVGAALLFFTLTIINQMVSSKPLAAANEIARVQSDDTQRNIRNAEVATAMGMMPALKARWRERQDQMLEAQEAGSKTAGSFKGVIKTLRLAIQSAAIAAGAYLVLQQEISPGMLIAGSILIGRALQPVEIAINSWKGFIDAKQQYDRLTAWLELTPQTEDAMELPLLKGEVVFRQAVIAAPGAKRATINGATFTIPAGSTCMVSGPSGAGKSTIVRGLLGLWPAQGGEIRIDGADAFKYDRAQLGPQLGYLPQDIEILQGTVAENIARFQKIDSDLVIQAASDAGIHDFILSLSDGYDTVLGQPGGSLSPGQRQRVALARALYNRPKLVVLDEPNSNLDEAGEKALAHAVGLLKRHGSTVVIVSHRQSILPLADNLLIIQAGRVADFGAPREVIQRARGGSVSNEQKRPKPPAVQTVPISGS